MLRRLDRPNVRFLYDRYHAILNGEPLGWAVDADMPLVGHIQIAGVPDRHELGTGQHDWSEEFVHLLEAGYSGYVGLELIPLADSGALYSGAREILAAAGGNKAG